MKRLLIALPLLVLTAAPASAQIPVTDVLNLVQARIIQSTRHDIYGLQEQLRILYRRVARGISLYRDKNTWVADGFPLWRTRYTDPPLNPDSLLWFDAINGGGDPTGIGYRAVTRLLRTPDQALAIIGLAGSEWLRRELATIDLSDSAQISGIQTTGTIRGIRRTELDALRQLEGHVRNPDLSGGAVAEVIESATLLRTRQNEREIGIARSIAELLLVETQRDRNQQVGLLNRRIAAQQVDRDEGGSMALGSADEIYHFSLK